MTLPPEEDLLRQLPTHDVDAAFAERLRHRAHEILTLRGRERTFREAAGWSAYYYRFVEPTGLLLLGLGYLVSSVQAALALFQ